MIVNKRITGWNSHSIFRYIPDKDTTVVPDRGDLPLISLPDVTCQAVAEWWCSHLFKIGYTLPDMPDILALRMLEEKLDGFMDTEDAQRTKYIEEFVTVLKEVRIPKKETRFDHKIGSLEVDYHAEYALMYFAALAGIKGSDMTMYPTKTHMDIYDDGGVIAYDQDSSTEYLIKSPMVLALIEEEEMYKRIREAREQELAYMRSIGLLP